MTTTPVIALPERIAALTEQLQSIAASVKEALASLKIAQKQSNAAEGTIAAALAAGVVGKKKRGRRARAQQEAGSSEEDASKPKKPSGFAKPTLLSPELSAFMGLPAGANKVPRTDVTRAITRYIKEKGLADTVDKRIILPDAKLASILSPVEEGKKLTYFNLQAYIKHHFIKESAAPAAAQ